MTIEDDVKTTRNAFEYFGTYLDDEVWDALQRILDYLEAGIARDKEIYDIVSSKDWGN